MFQRLSLGGVELDPSHASVLLDVVADFGLPDPELMHGSGRKLALISNARAETWRRLVVAGVKQKDIAAMFGVSSAAVSIALKRHALDLPAGAAPCPCCGRPFMPALRRG